MAERTPKLVDMREAAALVQDGDRIAFGGFAVYQKPMAFVHELVRAGKRDLTIVGCTNSLEADLLIGAGCVKRIETSYVGLEKFGLAKNYRRAAEAGSIEVVHYPEMVAWDRFRAYREGLAFWPVPGLGGSDIVNQNPDIKPFSCPITGKKLWAVPAAQVDVVVVHAVRADKYGNAQMGDRHMLPQSQDTALSRATRNVIVTADEIVDTAEIQKTPHRTHIPAFRTRALVAAPMGTHPTPTLTLYKTDDAFFRFYAQQAATKESFAAFLDTYIYGTASFEEYQALVGTEQLNALREVD